MTLSLFRGRGCLCQLSRLQIATLMEASMTVASDQLISWPVFMVCSARAELAVVRALLCSLAGGSCRVFPV